MRIHRSFGKVLKTARKRAGLSQEALAHLADLDRTYIGMLERGLRQPTLNTVFALANALKVRPSQLIAMMERSASH